MQQIDFKEAVGYRIRKVALADSATLVVLFNDVDVFAVIADDNPDELSTDAAFDPVAIGLQVTQEIFGEEKGTRIWEQAVLDAARERDRRSRR